jgi:hypothetical protein
MFFSSWRFAAALEMISSVEKSSDSNFCSFVELCI